VRSWEERSRRLARRMLPLQLFQLLAELYNSLFGIRAMGWSSYHRLRSLCHDRRPPDGTVAEVAVRNPLHPLLVRAGTSDATEVIHTVVRKAYAFPLPPEPVRTVIDAGANIGDSTVWFLSRFPSARVVAVELDGDDFRMLQQNCRPYGDRAFLLRAGLWPRTTNLRVAPGHASSDISVFPAGRGEPSDWRGLTPMDILGAIGEATIDVFKCDIEGAELELFSSDDDAWLGRTRCLYVDVHSPRAEAALLAATRDTAFFTRGTGSCMCFKGRQDNWDENRNRR
jgi:FkbM family methyltransferase